MKRFFLGIIIGAVITHYAEERKKKMAIDKIMAAGEAVGEVGGAVTDVVKSAADNIAGTSDTPSSEA